MEMQGRLIGGLALALMGVLGVSVTCGLPMWRETSFVGANIVTAQSVWDGLWQHCIVQATGQMQCKKHLTAITLTSDIQAGRPLTLISIIAGFLGFIVTLLGGGVVNCSGDPPDPLESPTTLSARKKACLLGGALCLLAAVLCLISVSWSAALTVSVYNDPLVAAPLKREVGSSIYIGFASALLLLLGGALMCSVCGEKETPPPSYYAYRRYSSSTLPGSSRWASQRSDVVRSNGSGIYDQHLPNRMEYPARVRDPNSQLNFGRNPSNRSGTPDKGRGLFVGMQPNMDPNRPPTVPQYNYVMS